jgi:hypothetical protein
MIFKGTIHHQVSIKKFLRLTIVFVINKLSLIIFKPLENKIPLCCIVGCGHTGTTLLASKLSNHPKVMGIGRETKFIELGINSLFCSRQILNEWQYFAERDNKNLILEKTPKHIYCYKEIKKVAPNSKIIILVRNPLDTIASLFERFNDLDYCIERWIFDHKEALKIKHKSDVMLIHYENLTKSPFSEIEKICLFLNLTYLPEIIQTKDSIYSKVKQNSNMEVRKKQINQPIYASTRKWQSIFNQAQLDRINSRTKQLADQLGYEPNGEI